MTKSGYLEPEDESEDEYEDPEPRSWLEDTFHVVSEFAKSFLTVLVMFSAGKKVYNGDPVRAFTSVIADASFPENAPEAQKQLGKMTVEYFVDMHKEKLFVELKNFP